MYVRNGTIGLQAGENVSKLFDNAPEFTVAKHRGTMQERALLLAHRGWR